MSKKISTKTIQAAIYDRTSGSAKYVDDSATYKRPDIEMLTDGFSGLGIMGEIDLPAIAQVGGMEGEIGFTASNKRVTALFTPGSHVIEARWVTNVLDTATGKSKTRANKEICTILPKNLGLGDIEANSANEPTLTYEIIAYEYICDGESLIKVDKLNNVFKINGTDYAKQIRDAL